MDRQRWTNVPVLCINGSRCLYVKKGRATFCYCERKIFVAIGKISSTMNHVIGRECCEINSITGKIVAWKRNIHRTEMYIMIGTKFLSTISNEILFHCILQYESIFPYFQLTESNSIITTYIHIHKILKKQSRQHILSLFQEFEVRNSILVLPKIFIRQIQIRWNTFCIHGIWQIGSMTNL